MILRRLQVQRIVLVSHSPLIFSYGLNQTTSRFFHCFFGPIRKQYYLLLSHTQMHIRFQKSSFFIVPGTETSFTTAGLLQPQPSRHYFN